MKAYLHRGGKTYGPYPENILLEFLENGHAVLSDRVFALGGEDWVELGTLLGLSKEGLKIEQFDEIKEIGDASEKDNTLFQLTLNRARFLHLLTIFQRRLLGVMDNSSFG